MDVVFHCLMPVFCIVVCLCFGFWNSVSLCSSSSRVLTHHVHKTGVKRCVLHLWLLVASQYFTVNLCALESSWKGLQVILLPGITCQKHSFSTMDMILFRNKDNLISTWLKVSQGIENQVPDFKHWCPLSYYLVFNIYYLVLQISKLKCCPLDCGILEGKQYVLYFPSSLCSRSQYSLTVDLVWVPRSKWGQRREQFARSIQVYYRITRCWKDGTFTSTWVNAQKAIRFRVY